jgi:hypothetical protein
MILINSFAGLREAVSLVTFRSMAEWRSQENNCYIVPQVREADSWARNMGRFV